MEVTLVDVTYTHNFKPPELVFFVIETKTWTVFWEVSAI